MAATGNSKAAAISNDIEVWNLAVLHGCFWKYKKAAEDPTAFRESDSYNLVAANLDDLLHAAVAYGIHGFNCDPIFTRLQRSFEVPGGGADCGFLRPIADLVDDLLNAMRIAGRPADGKLGLAGRFRHSAGYGHNGNGRIDRKSENPVAKEIWNPQVAGEVHKDEGRMI